MAIAHLHVQSHYSFGRGTASPERLCATAARRGVESLALCDLDGLYGVPSFLRAARRHGIHPVIGASLPDRSVPRSISTGRAVVLARDLHGYREICALLSMRHAAPRTPLNRLLEGLSDHLWILSPDLRLLRAIRRVRGADFLLAELRAGSRWGPLAAAAEELGIPSVAVAAVQLAEPADRRFQRLLLAVTDRRPFAAVHSKELASEQGWMLDEAAMKASFSPLPSTLERALEVAWDCHLEDLARAAVTEQGEALSWLRSQVERGARRHFGEGELPEHVQRRLTRELAVLSEGTWPALLRRVTELVQRAKEQRLPLCGHPHTAGSLVAFCLGISAIDPLANELPFEPPFDDALGSAPRLVLPVANGARQRLIDGLRSEIGAARVGRPGCFRRWTPREAVRDVARCAGIPGSECERVLGQLPADWRGQGLAELLARLPQLRGAGLDEPPWRRILGVARRLEGVPQRLDAGTGLLVAPGPLGDFLPIEVAQGLPVGQWDQQMAAQMGLVTIDLPNSDAASLLLEVGRALDSSGRDRHIDLLDAAPIDLRPLLETLAAGRTLGCPDLEDVAARRRLRRRPPADLEQLLAILGEHPEPPTRAELLVSTRSGLCLLQLRETQPAAFFAGLLRWEGGRWARAIYASEARRAGLRLLPPCVQRGAEQSTIDGRTLRLGLAQIRGLRPDQAGQIVRARRGGPFTSLEDFLRRVPGGADEVNALVSAGALDHLDERLERPELRERHRRWRWKRGRSAGADPGRRHPMPGQGSKAARLRDELRSLGMTLSGHPLELVATELPPGLHAAADFPDAEGRSVQIAGWVAAGEPGLGPPPPDLRWRATCDEPSGLFDVSIPSAVLHRDRPSGEEQLHGPCLFHGVVRRTGCRCWLDVSAVRAVQSDVGFWR